VSNIEETKPKKVRSYKKLRKDGVITDRNPDLIELTLRQFFKIFLVERLILKKQKQYNMHDGKLVELTPPKTHKVAIVLDSKVMETLVINPKFADLLLANPTFVEVDEDQHVHAGRTFYVEGKFITPDPEQPATSS
jgi:hypothetical protein